ncbi:S-adenosyl-L-methionine-dependent methyltransferase [Amylostereum chailletii]|nr:S-adenosyl-L-methionine-dependent methyltransferase [Amylostereum chailletii]
MDFGKPSPNLSYVLVDGPPEVRRLSGQYLFMKNLFNHPTLLPPSIDVSKLHRVLDAAAGTAVWALDLAGATPHLELYACDITTAKFPPDDVLATAGVSAFEQDLTQPFPEDMRGTFDLVHMTYLVYALPEAAWQRALRNVYDVLKPGGYLVLKESDPVIYTPRNPPPAEGATHDLDACMDGPSVVHAMNSIFTGLALKSGFVVGLSYRFADLLAAASFHVVASERALSPTGALCATQRGLRDAALAEFAEFSAENMNTVFDVLSKVLLSKGALEAPRGVVVGGEEERVRLLGKIREVVDEGTLVVMSEWVAQK